MTKPDEALLYARQQALGYTNPALRDEIWGGRLDHVFGIPEMARGYRAGSAASAERIKELEGAVRSLIGIIDSNGLMHDPVYPPLGFLKRHDGQPGAEKVKHARRAVNEARALLKDPDQ